MKSVVIRTFGAPDVFDVAETEIPAPPPGHVRINVASSSVNPIDTKIRSGAVAALAPEFPAVLNGDVAGVVDEICTGVTSLQCCFHF